MAVNYLTGFPLREGTIESAANIRVLSAPFNGLSKYGFKPAKTPSPVSNYKLFTATTDNQGKSSIKNNTDFKKYGSVVQLTIDSKINLPGGGLNTETESYILSPFDSYVGIEKSYGKGWRGSFRYGEKPIFEIINVDEKGQLETSSKKLKLEVLKYETDWWYDRYRLARNGHAHTTHRYESVHKQDLNTSQGKTSYTHDDPKFESGMYMLRVTDPESGHVSEHRFHYISNTNYSVQSDPRFINLELEKSQYKIGDKLELKLPSIADAQALVSLESGDRVLDMFWLDLNNPNLELDIKEAYYPNFYLHVSIVQNYEQHANDRPMRMYTVEKIMVEMPEHTLKPVIRCPEKVEPNSEFEITVTETNGREMEYTLAVVDQGLLNLTGFRTPDPHKHFAKTIALKVMTWDIFELLIHSFNPNYAGIVSIGGDGILKKKMDESADFNRFEPVAYHLGPFKINSNGSKAHKITLPNYLGQLKLMVVATDEASFGSEEAYVKVASPLMVQSQLPRTLNITDKVQVPVTLFKDEPSITQVKVNAKTNNGFIKFNNSNMESSLANDDQSIETMNFVVGEKSGEVDIAISAVAGKYTSNEETKIYVNYPNAYSEKEERIKIEPGEEKVIDITSFGFEETRNVDLTVAGALIPNFSKHYNSLLNYPYGCLEQTTSRGFSLLFIEGLMALSPKQAKERIDFIDAAITKVQSYQRGDGRFNYWRNGYYHQWSDLYAAHFLIEASDMDQMVNQDVLDNWIEARTKKANNWSVSGVDENYLWKSEMVNHAYALYLLSKAGYPAKSAMNRFRSKEGLPQMAKILLSGAYHYANMDQMAVTLLNEGLTENYDENIYRYSFGSPIRNKAIVIEIMSAVSRSTQLDRYYEDWVTEVNKKRWLSTQEKGFMFLAAKAYLGDQNIAKEIEFDIESKQFNSKEKLPSLRNKNFNWTWDKLIDEVKIENISEAPIYATKTERAISDELYTAPKSNGIDMTVTYTNSKNSALNFSSMTQGEDIDIKVTIRNNELIDLENLALNVKMPSGWELINPRLYTTSTTKNDAFVFQDYRDDKVYTFFTLNKGKSKTFRFKAKAALKGDYYLPAISCEDMYNGEIYAKDKATRAVIN